MTKSLLIVLTILMLGVATALGLVLGTAQPDQGHRTPPTLAGASIGGTLALHTHKGAVFDQTAFARDTHFLVFFGFANCPGICPMELDKMSTALHALPAETQAKIQPLFITLDPERDTNEMLAAFLQDFHPKLIALTGTQAEVNAASDQWRVYAEFLEPIEDGSYMINHSTYTYLMDPQMKPMDIFKMEDTAEFMAERLAVRLRS